MFDHTIEKPITFTEAAASLPRRRAGKKTNVSTIYRWATGGLKGTVLGTIQIGGTRCTSHEALQRFFEQLAVPSSGALAATSTPALPPAHRRTRSLAQWDRDAAKAGKALEARGA